ncbi:hypothetical protein MLPF_1894 [Mycobacterium lepromatosis]|nr:hypothetical protein MLPF_1894 [Mycobacterium lepromatosis]
MVATCVIVEPLHIISRAKSQKGFEVDYTNGRRQAWSQRCATTVLGIRRRAAGQAAAEWEASWSDPNRTCSVQPQGTAPRR